MDIERIYNQYFRIIYGYLLSLCRNPHLAEELAQETFLKALTRTQPENEENDNTIAWLYTIARNLYFQHYNKSRRRQDILKNNTSGQIADSPETEVMQRHGQLTNILTGIDNLPLRRFAISVNQLADRLLCHKYGYAFGTKRRQCSRQRLEIK